MEPLGPIFFAVLAATWVLAVIELVGVLLMQTWAFRIGLVAARSEDTLGSPFMLRVGFRGQTDEMTYRVIEGDRCLFRERMILRWEPRMGIKGTLSWGDGRFTTICRYPFGVMVFLAAWLTGWTAGGITALAHRGIEGVSELAIGWGFVVLIIGYTRLIEVKRFQQRAKELRGLFAARNPGV